jgi:hypothetical protein
MPVPMITLPNRSAWKLLARMQTFAGLRPQTAMSQKLSKPAIEN